MKLTKLIENIGTLTCGDGQACHHRECNPDINAIANRAQDVHPGDLFVAIRGFHSDGHDFIEEAVAQGASAIVCERDVRADIPCVIVENSRKSLARLAAVYYGHPSAEMILIGITGTNGKTTTSYLVESILDNAGFSVGVIGTVNYRYCGKCYENPVTTPESLDLQRILSEMRAAGVTHVVMEVSSHALDLYRVHQCCFDIAVFTNFTQDHLDHHKTMERYWDCKRKLFLDILPKFSGQTKYRAVLNTAVDKGRELAQQIDLPFLSCGDGPDNDLYVQTTHFDLKGIRACIRTHQGDLDIISSLVGRHNLENILSAASVAVALEIPLVSITNGIASLKNVAGRLEPIANTRRRFIFVDYAHTPDALESSLWALRALTADRIICVFGCGGDRDRGKRPKMGAIAGRLSDLMVVTSDNPRTEPPEQIIAEIVAGVRSECRTKYCSDDLVVHGFKNKGYVVIPDRHEAVITALSASRMNDTILIAGKGHETYQLVGDQKISFDDRVVVRAALEKM